MADDIEAAEPEAHVAAFPAPDRTNSALPHALDAKFKPIPRCLVRISKKKKRKKECMAGEGPVRPL